MAPMSTKKIRKKKAKHYKVIAVSLTIDLIDHLKDICIKTAVQTRKPCTMSHLVRETLLQAYPPPKQTQLEMF